MHAMPDPNRKDNTGRTIAVVGGGALLLLLLLRGKGWAAGAGSSNGSGDGPAPDAPTSGTTAAPPPPCHVRIDADGLQLDGSPASLATITEHCRAAGSAEVRATGAAITGVVAEVVRALQAAGVRVWAAYDVWNTVNVAPTRRPA